MSTAGKVLTVLILLVMLGWTVMLSAVTQLNINWQTKIAKQDADAKVSDEKLAKATTDYRDATEKTLVEQVAQDRDLRDIQGRLVTVEGRRSVKTEDLSRLQIQVADYQAAVSRAATNKTSREAEKARAEENLGKERERIAALQGQNAQLRDQLTRLQDDFKRLLAGNSRATRPGTDRPAAQPTSDRRSSPSS